MILRATAARRRFLAFFSSVVPAGFPSPAEDFVEARLDLNEHLIRRPAATFIVRVEGESMLDAGIRPGDLLIVDRSLEPRPGNIVVAVLDGELTVKRLRARGGEFVLEAGNPAFPAIRIADGTDCTLWGVVSSAIRRFDRR